VRDRSSVKPSHAFCLVVFVAVLAWSAISPHDRFTWWLEVLPAVAGVAILVATYRSFTFTTLAYALVCAHGIILVVGGHYTYAEMPWFDWLQDRFDLDRNYYDRVGHFAQGFVPAVVAREILLRCSPLRPGGWSFVIVTSIALAISALYELLEWAVAVATGAAAEAFLGTQGDVWDTQWDMFLALCGAMIAQLLLARPHDRALAQIDPRGGDA
jgi:putative membrane protein